jgi:hypothetical protein
LPVLLLSPFLFGLISLCLGQDANWDLRNYHLYNAYAFLTGRISGGLDLLPSQAQFFLNPLPDVPYYWMATHWSPRTAGFVMGCVQGLAFPLLFMLAFLSLTEPRNHRKSATCLALAALGMYSVLGLAELGGNLHDTVTSLGVLLSAVLVLRRLDFLAAGAGAEGLIRAAVYGLPAGLMAGLKMTCMSFSAACCVALLAAVPSRRGLFLAAAFGTGLAAGFAVTYGWWGLQLLGHTGNPVFPMLNNVFRSPLLPPVPVWDYRLPQGVMSRLFFPFLFGIGPELVANVPSRDLRIPVLYALFFAAAILRLRNGAPKDALARKLPARYLLCLGAAGYAFWLCINIVYRYLAPLDALAPLLIVFCLDYLPGTRKARAETAATVLIALALLVKPGDWGRKSQWQDELVSVSPPPAKLIAEPAKTLVLMAGFDPYSYLIPAFPAETGFLRIDSRSFPAGSGYSLLELARTRIHDHRGPMMLLLPESHFDAHVGALKPYGLALDAKTCKRLTDNLWEAQLDNRSEPGTSSFPHYYKLCSVRKTGK